MNGLQHRGDDMKKYALLAALLLGFTATPATAETLNNDTIIALIGAGLGQETIIAKIRNSSGTYDLSTDKLIALKQKGVSDAIIAAMLDASTKAQTQAAAVYQNDSVDPKLPHASGVYVLADWLSPAKMVRLDSTTANQARTSNFFGAALSGGLAPLKIKTAVPNPTSKVKVRAARPTFYFYMDQANANGGIGALYFSSLGASVTSPSEFSIVRFAVKKGLREVTTGKAAAFAGQKFGLVDKDKVLFTTSDVSPGVFKVALNTDMPKGEYGFVYSTGGGIGGGAVSRVFDFTIE
jgi:hypothetical protein